MADSYRLDGTADDTVIAPAQGFKILNSGGITSLVLQPWLTQKYQRRK